MSVAFTHTQDTSPTTATHKSLKPNALKSARIAMPYSWPCLKVMLKPYLSPLLGLHAVGLAVVQALSSLKPPLSMLLSLHALIKLIKCIKVINFQYNVNA